MTNNDVYTKVFADVVAQMELGVAPWVRPWTGAPTLPYNAITGEPYRGGNVLALWVAGMPYTANGWCTFKQALAAGCVVRKGQKGTTVFFMNTAPSKRQDRDDTTDKTSRYFFAKAYTVFNVEQLSDLPGNEGAVAELRARCEQTDERSAFLRCEAAEQLVHATGAQITHGGSRACYIPSRDLIQMPTPDSFPESQHYYGTLFHELAHWSGHERRLNRITPSAFGSPEYAFEELVAELAAAFLCARVGLDVVSQSASYLQGWAKACREHTNLLPRAASAAQAAANFLTEAPASVEEAAAATTA